MYYNWYFNNIILLANKLQSLLQITSIEYSLNEYNNFYKYRIRKTY